MQLFRHEAMRGQDRLHGDVSLVPPVSWQILTIFLVTTLVLAGVFIASASYGKVTIVTGTITGDRGLMKASSPRSGTIDRILVTEGQTVRAGAPIARIGLATSDDSGTLEQRRAEALKRQSGLLGDRRQDMERSTGDRISALSSQISGAQNELSSISEQISQQRDLVATAETDLAKVRLIAERGFISGHDIRLREETLANRRQGLSRLMQDQSGRRTTIATAQADIARARGDLAIQKSEVDASREEIAREAAGDGNIGTIVIRAAVSGRVTGLTAHVGDVVEAGAVFATILPEGTKVGTTLEVPASAMALIDRGQEVRIAVDAFPYQTYGTITGRITYASGTTVPVRRPDGQTVEAFIVRTTAPPSITAYGARQTLRPGMTVTARIRTRSRSLVEWIFDPLLAVMQG